MRGAVLAFALFLAGCASTPPHHVFHLDRPRTQLFPEGIYQHDVTIRTSSEGQERHFRGIVSIQPLQISIVGLAALDTTAFRVTENRKTRELTVAIYFEPMKKYEPKLREFFGVLDRLLTLAWKAPSDATLKVIRRTPEGLPLEAETVGLSKNLTFLFKRYDENQIPGEIQITRPEFAVGIEVTGYDL